MVRQGLQYVAKGGTFLVFGVCPPEATIAVNPYHIYRNDISIVGSFALRKNIDQALHLMVSGAVNVRPLIAAQISMDELPAAVEQMANGRSPGKIQLTV